MRHRTFYHDLVRNKQCELISARTLNIFEPFTTTLIDIELPAELTIRTGKPDHRVITVILRIFPVKVSQHGFNESILPPKPSEVTV